MLKKFQSLADSQIGYAYDSSAYSSQAPIDCHFRMFSTYGDGLTQHSPDHGVTAEHLADYLMSAAEAMLTCDELAQEMCYALNPRVNTMQIEFAASVIFKEPKEEDRYSAKGRKYFSLEQLKISGAPAKEHDKRYTEITKYQDGTPESIKRILTPEYASGLQHYLIAEAIREWTNTGEDRGYVPLPADFLKWFERTPGDGREGAQDLRRAFEIARYAAEAYRMRANAQTGLDYYKERIAAKAAKAAEGAAEIAAAEDGTGKDKAQALLEAAEAAS